jgi:hypothetical protein
MFGLFAGFWAFKSQNWLSLNFCFLSGSESANGSLPGSESAKGGQLAKSFVQDVGAIFTCAYERPERECYVFLSGIVRMGPSSNDEGRDSWCGQNAENGESHQSGLHLELGIFDLGFEIFDLGRSR